MTDTPIVIEAESMDRDNFKIVGGRNASDDCLVKIKGSEGTLSTTFNGDAGVYDFTVCVQDENDGQSVIEVVINGTVVDTITLDQDNNGRGSNNGHFSDVTLSGIEIPAGAEIELRAYRDGGEYVRIDKIELVKTGDLPDGGNEVVFCEEFNEYCLTDSPNVVYSDFYGHNGEAITSGGADGQMLLAPVDVSDVENATVNIDVRVIGGGFEQWGTQWGDMVRIEVIDQNGNVIVLDTFTGNGDVLTGDLTGQTIDFSTGTISYALGSGIESAQIRIVSDISSCYECVAFENVKIVGQETPPEGQVCIGFDVDADGNMLVAGDTVDGSLEFEGVTFEAIRKQDTDGVFNDGMIFDSANPTGGDWDLATANQGNILIVSEDGDSSDPDDNVGGTIVAHLDTPSTMNSIRFIDTEEAGSTVELFDINGNLIDTFAVPTVPNGGQAVLDLNDTPDVSKVVITLQGSGAIDDFKFVPGDEVPGSISGNVFCDLDCDGLQDGGRTFGAELVVNGGFEDNNLPNSGVDWNISSGDLPGWFLLGSQTADLLEENIEGHGNATGQAIIDLDAGSILCQEVDVPMAGTYLLSLSVLENPNISSSANSITIFIDGTAYTSFNVVGQDTVTFEIPLDVGITRLDIKSGATYGDGPGLDEVSLRKIIDEPDEPGKEGVTVMLLDANGDPVLDDQGNMITTVTDANGDYTFDGVDPGDYRVKFTLPNGQEFTDQNVGSDDTIDSDADPNTGITDVISVGSGEDVTDVDAGLKDAPLGSIAGTYFCDTDNDDLDNGEGEPGVSGLQVFLLNGDGTPVLDGSGNPVSTTTDANGDYIFTDLPAGDYKVAFEVDGSKALVNQGTLVNGESVNTEASDVDPNQSTMMIAGVAVVMTAPMDLAAGEDKTDVDVGVEELGSISGTYFCDTDDDSLDNGEGEPGVAGKQVFLLNADGTPVVDGSGNPVSTTTDANGDYSFTGLEGGDYKVAFEVDATKVFVDQGALMNGESVDPTASDVDPNQTTMMIGGVEVVMTEPMTLGVGEDKTDVDVGVEEPAPVLGSISGTYFCDTDGDELDNGEAEPGVAGKQVFLLNSDGTPVLDGGGNPVSTTTDANGDYSFIDLPAGDYKVAFEVDSTKAFVDQGMLTNGESVDPTASDVDPDQATMMIGGVEVAMTEPMTLAEGEDKTDVDAGVVELASLGDFVWHDLNGDGVQDAGEPGIPNVTVKLLDGTGAPVLDGMGNPVTTTTDGSGLYSFTGLKPGDYKVMFVQPAGFTEVSPLDAGGDDNADSDADPNNGLMSAVVNLSPGENDTSLDAGFYNLASLGDFVWLDEDGDGIQDAGENGIGGVVVNLLDGNMNFLDTTTTAADGSYDFSALQPGEYFVEFVAPDTPAGSTAGLTFSPKNQGADDAVDSDADTVTGKSDLIVLESGEHDPTIDAGLKACFDTDGLTPGELIGVNGMFTGLPLLSFNNDGTTNYNATTDEFTADGTILFGLDSGAMPIPLGTNPRIEVGISVDDTGALTDGTDGFVAYNDLDGSMDFSTGDTVLLQGDVGAFGAGNAATGNVDDFDILIEIDGGSLAGLFDPVIGMAWTSEFSTFDGDFTVDFNGEAKGTIANVGIDCLC